MRPVKILSSFFYAGYAPVAPGTAGSLAAAALYYVFYCIFGSSIYLDVSALVAALLASGACVALGRRCVEEAGEDDPSIMVLDEVAGMFVSLLFLHKFFIEKLDILLIIVAAFILFRLFDVLKPFGIRKLEAYPYGTGILLDDIAAGILANLCGLIAGMILLNRGLL